MESSNSRAEELAAPLNDLPHVDFCCAYGSSLLPNNSNKKPMVDYILGVSDPMQWHSQNLEKNRHHYGSFLAYLGSRTITQVADEIGVGVHFNPYVRFEDKVIKYGVIRMHDLLQDVLTWNRFYISGRLQKPVHILVDSLDVGNVNLVNLKAAASAALLLLPSEFNEEDLYAKICSLSYMGDLRMLFAEDKNKAKSIVSGSLDKFRQLYTPFLCEFDTKGLLKFSPTGDPDSKIVQDCSLSAACSLVSFLPATVQSRMCAELGEKQYMSESGRLRRQVVVPSKEAAAKCMEKALRRLVAVSSTRQAVSGFFAAGGVNAGRYLVSKISKALSSRS
ncbi:phosphatidate cytidylyltransferase, mitochondrial [Amborella trichopoda]|uniref:Phosphatidate cytidylyltransferase, mitochondrial n=1 Tax=Amborella trichopoda TaxID=13333 RepID=W1PVI6_AMBTC|nr:phosphatidate cytidylyltransferase, mitochondrial [Amborella trichopoda]XP_020526405.1 phosphatidate cytidylyltransferase, mitochondrial [Amborella trichopoda]XP_020526406.1 phosphatidate cytidylyltransferase, mitochondrial [Amborella trichopoda]ERN11701.1 hypothetical protein AMTR_s00022p00227870 [Amborella trichopoda]|eukprot:XP_006850120.1 phosphatidate cytidylyltransferase, mitochondrial [Amborella trichopoda]